AQRAGEPRLVHRLHPVPARDPPGPARAPPALPALDRRPHREGRPHGPTPRRAHSPAEAVPAPRPALERHRHGLPRGDRNLPATKEVLQGRADGLGIELREVDFAVDGAPEGEYFGALIQYPGASGRVWDPREVIAEIRSTKALAVVSADLLALTMLASPGSL